MIGLTRLFRWKKKVDMRYLSEVKETRIANGLEVKRGKEKNQ